MNQETRELRCLVQQVSEVDSRFHMYTYVQDIYQGSSRCNDCELELAKEFRGKFTERPLDVHFL